MNAQEYIKSDYAIERIELLLSQNPKVTMTPYEISDICLNIISKLNDLKYNSEETRWVCMDLLSSYNENSSIIRQLLTTAFDIDNSFHSARHFLLLESYYKDISIEDFEGLRQSIYLDNSDLNQSNLVGKGYEDYYSALCELILIGLGKSKGPLDQSKNGLMKYGISKYSLSTTGEQFYRHFKYIDINNMKIEVSNMGKKYRKKWKEIVIEISNNDADVILWLNKQPD